MAKVIKSLSKDILFNDAVIEKHGVQFRISKKIAGNVMVEGTMVNPSIDAGGLSYDDFYGDPDFEEDYFSGRYDVQCSACHGSGKQTVLGWDAFASEYTWTDGVKPRTLTLGHPLQRFWRVIGNIESKVMNKICMIWHRKWRGSVEWAVDGVKT